MIGIPHPRWPPENTKKLPPPPPKIVFWVIFVCIVRQFFAYVFGGRHLGWGIEVFFFSDFFFHDFRDSGVFACSCTTPAVNRQTWHWFLAAYTCGGWLCISPEHVLVDCTNFISVPELGPTRFVHGACGNSECTKSEPKMCHK